MSVRADQVVIPNNGRWWRGLSVKQERFVAEYLKDGNATQAAIRVGYKEKSAGQIGYLMLQNDRVRERLAELRAEMAMGANLTADRVKKEIARLAFVDIRKLYHEDGRLKKPHEWDDDTAAAIAGTEIDEIFEGTGENRVQVGETKKVKLWDKGRGLELATKVLGMVRESSAFNIGNLTIIVED